MVEKPIMKRDENGRNWEEIMKKTRVAAAIACVLCVTSCFCGCQNNHITDGTAKIEQNSRIISETTAPQGTILTENSTSAEKTPIQTANAGESHSPVSADWFDDAVFVGDSVTLKLSYYCDSHPEALGDAQFFCAGSLGYTNALWELDREDAVHPLYRGTNYLSQDCAAVTGANKVLVMLGMNDIALYGIDGTMESAETLIDNILAQTPDVNLYIQSVTPIINGMERGDLNNANIRAFNEKLQEFCQQNGYRYLDIYGLLADENGYLPLEYCGDPDAQGIHFTDAACELWANYFKENVG